VRNGDLPPISDLTTAADSVLTGLAQLGAYQTDTARAFISLFDSTHQYIVAEAAPSMRIAAGLPNDGLPDSLSLRGAAIPRSQGTCDHVLSLGMDPDGVTGDTELPLSFVPNLAQDGRFSSRPYCQFPGDGQFYAGVPIRTRKGINIGAYCVMSAVAPPGWGKQHDQRLRDISRAIMSHLEFRRYSHENHRYERFSRGLAAFVGGRSGGRNSQDIGNPLNPFPSGAGTPGYDGQHTQGSLLTVGDQHDYELPDPGSTMIPDGSLQKSDSSSPMSSYFTHLSFLPSVDQIPLAADPPFKPSIRIPARNTKDPDVVFSDAASVLQKTFNVDGCVFLNVTLGSRRPAGPSKSGAALDGSNIVPEGGAGFTSSSDEHNNGLYGDPADGICDRLGIATRAALDPKQLVSAGDSTSVGQMSRAFLAKLLKRYPNGNVFNFDAVGELQSSDSSEEDATRPVMLATPASEEHHRINPTASAQPSGSKRSRQPREGAFIQQAFSGARSVMFVPVWDPKRERWLSGGFVYSMAAAHSFSPNEDLGLMLAFCKVVSAEFLHMETQRTDKAKSDALGSLSHELRSPLHGIVLSTEMLNDTDLTVYQSNATHTIETCCRTLLDTIDHLLDYSKVNSLAPTSSKVGFGPVAQQNASIPATSLPSSFGKKSLYKHMRLDGLVEDVVVSVFAGFNIEYLSLEHVGSASNSKSSVSKNSSNRMTKLPASGVGTFVRQSVGKESSTNVTVYVAADPDCNWMLHVHAGAWRRIVMNLVGNSLKYTPSGMIKVSLSQEDSRRPSTQKIIKLTVSDTGCGIGKDFLQHSLFQPFSQENAMSPGIGLGLSLVKKMVSQLRGRIKVRSSEGEGTTIQVTLPYDSSTHVSQDSPGLLPEQDELFQKQLSDLQGLRISIDGFDLTWGSEGRSLVEMVCQRWLGLRLVSDEGISPDVLLRSEDGLVRPDNSLISPLAKVPMIVVCRDAAAAWQLYKAYETIDYAGRVVEFVSQP
jgi:signal transduction histidine kinase